MPENKDGQECLNRTLTVDPEPEMASGRTDDFVNRVTTCVIREAHTRLMVSTERDIDTAGRAEPVPDIDGARGRAELVWTDFRIGLPPDDLVAVEFALDSPLITRSPDLAAYAAESFEPGDRCSRPARPVGPASTPISRSTPRPPRSTPHPP